MQRRFSTRTFGLSARIAVTLLLVATLYAAIVVGVVALIVVEPAWALFVVFFAAVVAVTVAVHVGGAARLLLQASGARPLTDHVCHGNLERLSQLADVPVPSLFVVETPSANAFTVGSRRRSQVVVTTGLLESLDREELDAVLGHELAHIANHDAAVMTFASVPRTVGETMIGEEGVVFYLWVLVWWVGIPLWGIGSLLTLALSRYREFAADRGSALLTGRPEALMSALEKIAGPEGEIPLDDLRGLGRVEALCIVASGGTRLALFSDHPPLADRLARLAEMAREMGRPVGP